MPSGSNTHEVEFDVVKDCPVEAIFCAEYAMEKKIILYTWKMALPFVKHVNKGECHLLSIVQ